MKKLIGLTLYKSVSSHDNYLLSTVMIISIRSTIHYYDYKNSSNI